MISSLDQQAALLCPHCRAGSLVRRRDDTGEYVHDRISVAGGGSWSHTICWADGLRSGRLTFEQNREQTEAWNKERK